MEGLAFICGCFVGLGAILLGSSLPRPAKKPAEQKQLSKQVGRRMTYASIVSTAVSLLTGWFVLGILVWLFVFKAQVIFGGRRRAEQQIARSEAIASWIENLHDTLTGGAGLRRSIVTTAKAPPEAIGHELRDLAHRLESRDPLPLAISRFADELSDPSADLVAMALIMADDPTRHASNVGAVLETLGATVREEVNMARRVQANRAKVRTSVSVIAGVTVAMSTSLMIFSRDFMAPYGSVFGQVVLGIIGGIFALAFWYLQRMSKPIQIQRFFLNLEATP